MTAGRAPRQARPPRGLRLADLLSVGDETDETGRLLLEDSAPKSAKRDATRAGIRMKSVPCPYRDTPSRFGGEMNRSAYEALRRDTAKILGGFAWLRTQYLERNPGGAGRIQGLVDISKLGVSLPLVAFYRADDPVPYKGALPSFVAATFKASRGLLSAAFAMMQEKGADTPVSAAEVVAFADDKGHLARPESRRVCAAPTRLIERTIDVILTGEGADPDASTLGEVISFAMLWDFFVVEAAFNQALSGYRFVLERLMSTGAVTDPRELFNHVVGLGGDRRTFGEFTEAFLNYANAAQAALNQVLGRREDAPPLTFQDALKAL